MRFSTKPSSILIMLVLLAVFVVACTQPPSELPQAQIDGQNTEATGAPTNGMGDKVGPNPVVNQDEMKGDGVMGDGMGPGPEATGGAVGPIEARPINSAQSSFEFEGYGPGKSHLGTFTDMHGYLKFDNGELIGASGTIQADSVSTTPDRLQDHLKSADFFDVENYPTIEWSGTIDHSTMVGDLTFHGVTKEITIPVEIGENSLKADFLLDTHEFGMEYAGVNKDVRIAFEVVA